ncbi:MAG: hypothetical protein J6W94_05945 [Bacteroidales bacterium]|nr:hypothetical protein [Bacteroidales bacterium]MBP5676536.1 hypothetical protein [Bacteroidales bacterium]
MKKTLVLVLAVSATIVSGCDFVRKIAGRPTAKDVEEIRVERVRQEEARHQARLDSMKRIQQQIADSLALEQYLLDSLSQAKGTVMTPSSLGGIGVANLEYKYYIVVGAFRDPTNALRKKTQCDDAGFTAKIINFRNGLNAVAVCPSNSIAETIRNMKSVRGKSFCPTDGWILVNQ